MAGNLRINNRILSLLRARTVKKRTIIVGLKSDNYSREMLLRFLTLIVIPGDNVLAVHVQEPNDTFDPNTFHMHEDLCKCKQVDFQIKVCVGKSYITELSHQVRINFATILSLGCSTPWPKYLTVSKCLKALPPTCSLLVMDNGGRILIQKQGTSQQGSASKILQSSVSSLSKYSSYDQLGTGRQIQKSLTMPSSSTSLSPQQTEYMQLRSVKKTLQLPNFVRHELFQRLATLEAKESSRRFTLEELKCATNNFGPELLIGEGGHSKVYRANLDNAQAAAVKVLKLTESSEEDLFREVEMLSGLKHENIVQLIGFCYSKEIQAVVYNLLKDSLKQKVKQLRWSERTRVAIGVAKALDYLHSCSPPIIHRDVKSSNILLSDSCEPHARSLLSCGLCERLIDPHLEEDYNTDEMKTMMTAARLCLLHSSSRRPTMKTILRLFEEPEHCLKIQQRKEELLNRISSRCESILCRHDESDATETLAVDNS